MNHRQRMEACLSGGRLDRPPVAMWRHFPVDDQSPDSLASAVVNFQRSYDFDFVKVTPSSSYCIYDWGARDEWRGSSEGTREYTGFVIKHPEDWESLPVLDPEAGHLGGQLECLRLITAELGPDVPVIQTIFSPLSQAKNLVGRENLFVHLRRYPKALQAGLRTIAETARRFIEAASQTGIAGIFYAVQHAQYGLLSASEYNTFGRQYDLPLLHSAAGMWLNVLHLHGDEVMFDQLADYPVAVANWHDRNTSPSLSGAKDRYPGAVCGGLKQWETMVLGTPAGVREEARDAIRATHGERFILGTGCVLPIITPRANILAARRSVEIGG
jgi:uroporphyrinogen decarboxylase